MDLSTVFGKVLRVARETKGYSQEKLADLCKLDRTYISLLERGKRQPTLKTLFALSNALEISPTSLVEKIESLVKSGE